MPVTAGLVLGGGQVLGGLIKGIVGGGQKREGKNILKNLKYPDEQIPTEITTAAAEGLPSEQYNKAMKDIQQQQLVALRGAHDRRGGLGIVPSIQTSTNNATLGLNVEDAKARQQNQFRLASWKDKVWQNNVKEKYNQQYNYGMGLVGQGNQNLVGGIDQGIAGIGTGAYYGLTGGYGKGQQGQSGQQQYGSGIPSNMVL